MEMTRCTPARVVREAQKMQTKILTIRLPLPLHMGSVNCYLIETGSSYVLIDTGGSNARRELVRQLQESGCTPGRLDLVILTHGDFDHSANAAHLRAQFGAKIAMHAGDSAMVESGNIFAGRKRPNIIMRKLAPVFFGLAKKDRFLPDVLLEDGENLAAYGFNAKVHAIPGHSKGSIGILTSSGEFFCGDLLENSSKPAVNGLIDDLAEAEASVTKLEEMDIRVVLPGHGRPFDLGEVFKDGVQSAG